LRSVSYHTPPTSRGAFGAVAAKGAMVAIGAAHVQSLVGAPRVGTDTTCRGECDSCG